VRSSATTRRDKSELREVWQEAGAAVLGPGFQVPNWSARANLDNAPQLAQDHFRSVVVDRLPGQFRFPEPGPPLAWVQSFQSGAEDLVSVEDWAAVVTEVQHRVETTIDRNGTLIVTKDSGVIVAK
jgi:hypothetical protein